MRERWLLGSFSLPLRDPGYEASELVCQLLQLVATYLDYIHNEVIYCSL